MRPGKDDVFANPELPGLLVVLVVDQQHHTDEHGNEDKHEERWRGLGGRHHDRNDRGQCTPCGVDREAAAPARTAQGPPVLHHAGLADREVDEHSDGIERDQQVRLAARGDHQARGHHAQHHDAEREREPIPSEAEVTGHEPVLRQDRGQPREGVEARVRGQEEKERRKRLEQEEGQ